MLFERLEKSERSRQLRALELDLSLRAHAEIGVGDLGAPRAQLVANAGQTRGLRVNDGKLVVVLDVLDPVD